MIRHKVVCLIGSTRYFKEMAQVAHDLSLGGSIVLRPHVVKSQVFPRAPLSPEDRTRLDHIRYEEVELADEVYVLNIDGYMGESTSRQLAYARSLGKPEVWHEPIT